jgi:hypothetical protein
MLTLEKQINNWLRGLYISHRLRADVQASLKKREVLIVHQMGKVGSSTIVKSLEELQLDIPIFHTHSLNIEHLRSREKYKRLNCQEVPPRVIQGQYLRKAIDRGLLGKSWKVISLVRDPISRNISAFFQNINDYFPDYFNRYSSGSLQLDEIVSTFLEKYNHDAPLNWFDQEMKEVFGIDVFSSDFPISKGYKIFKHDQIDLLLLRLEDIDNCSQNAFREFLGIEEFTLKGANIGDGKLYKDAYQQIKNSVSLPNWYLEKFCSSKLMRHFYSESEINGFRTTWLKSTNEFSKQ